MGKDGAYPLIVFDRLPNVDAEDDERSSESEGGLVDDVVEVLVEFDAEVVVDADENDRACEGDIEDDEVEETVRLGRGGRVSDVNREGNVDMK